MNHIKVEPAIVADPTVIVVVDELYGFAEYMNYTMVGKVVRLPDWRTPDFKYYLEFGLRDIEDWSKIIQGAFSRGEEYAPVQQIKRYLLLNTHL